MATKAKVCSKKATGNGAFVESCDQIPKEVDLGRFLWALKLPSPHSDLRLEAGYDGQKRE